MCRYEMKDMDRDERGQSRLTRKLDPFRILDAFTWELPQTPLASSSSFNASRISDQASSSHSSFHSSSLVQHGPGGLAKAHVYHTRILG